MGENLAREDLSDLSDSSSESDDWDDLEWSGSEDGPSMKGEVKVRREVEEDIYTQAERLFAESSGESSDESTTETKKEMEEELDLAGIQEANTGKGKAPETVLFPSAPPAAPHLRAMPWTQKPVPKGAYTLEAAPSGPTPQWSSSRAGPSIPRGPRQKWTDDTEIMQHLVGGMANLAIPMSQDDSGRWRIHKRQ